MLLETRTSQSISWTLTWSRIIERISSARGIPRKTKLKICVQRIVTEPAIPWQVGRILNSYSLHIGHLPMPCSFTYIALEQLLSLALGELCWLGPMQIMANLFGDELGHMSGPLFNLKNWKYSRYTRILSPSKSDGEHIRRPTRTNKNQRQGEGGKIILVFLHVRVRRRVMRLPFTT